jgi:hypothetical protein
MNDGCLMFFYPGIHVTNQEMTAMATGDSFPDD